MAKPDFTDFDEWVSRTAQWQDQVAAVPAIVHDHIKKGRLDSKIIPKHGAKSLFVDPLAVQYMMGYKDRKYSLSYDFLKRIPHQLAIVGAIIQTRCNQVASFSIPYRSSKSIGYVIKHKDPSHMTTKSELKFIKELESYIYECGYAEPNPHNKNPRDDFETFLKKIVRDSLLFDQTCVEIVPDRRGIPYEFLAVDASTIRIAADYSVTDDPNKRKNSDVWNASTILGARNPFKTLTLLDKEVSNETKFVQVVDGRIVNAYTANELAFGVRNPRSDIYIQGYGYGELEQLVTIVSAHLFAEEYNRRFFTNASAPKGILNFRGDAMSPDMLEAFKRQWTSSLNGVQNCVAGSTRIYTAEHGFKPIEEICGDKQEVPITVWTGTSWESGLAYKTAESKILCNTTFDNGVTLSTSPDHKIRIIGDSGDPEWRLQKDLIPGDVVLMNRKDTSLDTNLYCYDKEVTPEFMEVLGWFLGDGNVSPRTNDRGYSAGAMLRWFYNTEKELDILDKHLNVIQEFFPKARHYVHYRTEQEQLNIKHKYGFKSVSPEVHEIQLQDINAYKWFKDHGFIEDKKIKSIPANLYTMPDDYRAAYLRGLFSADGNNAKLRSPELTCCNHNLRDQIKHLLASLGIRTSYSEDKSLLRIKDRDIFFNNIGFLQDHKQPKTLTKLNEANKYDRVPRATLLHYLTAVRENNKNAEYKLLTKRERMDLNSILSGSDGCSRPRLLKFMNKTKVSIPSWMLDYHTVTVVSTHNTGLYVPMYDVSVNDQDHMFVGDNIVISNSWKTPILQSEQGVDWIDLHPSNREMEYGSWLEYLIKVTCFTENTPVTMSDGSLVSIKDISPGDTVLTHKGESKTVLNTQTSTYTGDLLTINVGGREIETTPNHPFYVCHPYEDRLGKNFDLATFTWEPASSIDKGSYLVIPKPILPETVTSVDLLDYVDNTNLDVTETTICLNTSNNARPIRRYIDLNEHTGYLLGLYAAEGSSTDNCVTFSLHRDEDHLRNKIEAFADYMHINVGTYYDKKSLGCNVNISSKVLAEFMSNAFNRGAGNKHVPSFILEAPIPVKQAFIAGCIEGDGAVDFINDTVRIRANTTSRSLQQDISTLLLSLGVYGTHIDYKSDKYTNGHYYSVDMFGSQAAKLSSFLSDTKGEKSRYYISSFNDQGRSYRPKIKEHQKGFLVPVSSVSSRQFVGRVHNLEVEDEHTYLANQVSVHNCAVFLMDPAELNFDLHGGVQQTPLFESSQEWKLKASRDRGLKPLLRFIAGLINKHIISKIDDHFVFDFVGLDELTEQEKHTLRMEQVSSYRTLNEIRREDDLPDVEHGNIILSPTYLQAMQIKQQMEQAEQQQQQQPQQQPAQGQAGAASVEGGEPEPSQETPEYADSFGKSMNKNGRYLEIDLSSLDSWMDDIGEE